MATKSIAFINFKGGVGKTASVVNIGSNLAKYHGKKVLIVDLDAQANSSLWLLQPPQWKSHIRRGKAATYQIFADAANQTTQFDFNQAVFRGAPMPIEGFPLLPNLHLIPSSVSLITIEDQLHQPHVRKRFQLVYQALKGVYDDYDYVLFDCPPNLYTVTKNALFASDFCVVPYIPDYLSLSGFQVLAEAVHLFGKKMKKALGDRKAPELAAILISHYRSVGNVFNQAVNELELALQLLKKEDRVHRKAKIFEPYVRHCVGVAESTNEHLPVMLHKPGCIGSQDYADVASQFVKHFEKI